MWYAGVWYKRTQIKVRTFRKSINGQRLEQMETTEVHNRKRARGTIGNVYKCIPSTVQSIILPGFLGMLSWNNGPIIALNMSNPKRSHVLFLEFRSCRFVYTINHTCLYCYRYIIWHIYLYMRINICYGMHMLMHLLLTYTRGIYFSPIAYRYIETIFDKLAVCVCISFSL